MASSTSGVPMPWGGRHLFSSRCACGPVPAPVCFARCGMLRVMTVLFCGRRTRSGLVHWSLAASAGGYANNRKRYKFESLYPKRSAALTAGSILPSWSGVQSSRSCNCLPQIPQTKIGFWSDPLLCLYLLLQSKWLLHRPELHLVNSAGTYSHLNIPAGNGSGNFQPALLDWFVDSDTKEQIKPQKNRTGCHSAVIKKGADNFSRYSTNTGIAM